VCRTDARRSPGSVFPVHASTSGDRPCRTSRDTPLVAAANAVSVQPEHGDAVQTRRGREGVDADEMAQVRPAALRSGYDLQQREFPRRGEAKQRQHQEHRGNNPRRQQAREQRRQRQYDRRNCQVIGNSILVTGVSLTGRIWSIKIARRARPATR